MRFPASKLGPWWVLAEDLGQALIGPFPSKHAADVHSHEGDAVRWTIPQFVVNHLDPSIIRVKPDDAKTL